MALTTARIFELIAECFPKDYTIRESQKLAIFKAIRAIDTRDITGIKHVFIEAPTGVGKSAIGYTIGAICRKEFAYRTSIITKTKMLQDVYRESFGNVIFDIKGKTNYPCSYDAEFYGTPHCVSLKKSGVCKPAMDCEYFQKRKLWSERASVRSTNTNFWLEAGDGVLLGEKNYSEVLIMDECHTIPGAIVDSTMLVFDIEDFVNLQKATTIPIMNLRMGFMRMQGYINNTQGDYLVVDDKLLDLIAKERNEMIPVIARLEEIAPDLPKLEEALGPIKELMVALEVIQNSSIDSEYHIFSRGSRVEIKPYHAKYVADYKLFRKADFFIHMSATICGAAEYARNLGIGSDEYMYVGLDTPYPVENRQVYYVPCGRMNNRERDSVFPQFVGAMDTLISMFHDRGIIHSVTYENAKKILELSEFKHRMYIPSDPYDGITFLNANPGGILVSPSIEEGVDLKGDLSRFQIIMKVPFGYLPDPIIKKQFETDPKSYSRDTVMRIVQASGRSIRSETDHANTFILDGAFDRLLDHDKDLFPQWYLNSIVEYTSFNRFVESLSE